MTKVEVGPNESEAQPHWSPGDLVWAKMKGFPFWPAKIISETEMPETSKKRPGSFQGVFFFGSNNYSYVEDKLIKDYLTYRKQMPPQKTLQWKSAVEEIEKYIADDSDLSQKMGDASVPLTDPQELQDEIQKLSETADNDDDKDSNSSKRSFTKVEETAASDPQSPKLQKTEKKQTVADSKNPKRTASGNGVNGCAASSSKLSPAVSTSPRKALAKGAGKTVGFIGLGNMGNSMVKNLANHNHSVFIFNRTTEKYGPLVRMANVKKVKDLAHLLRECDIVFCCLSDEAAVEQIMSGPNGILSGMKGHKSYVEMTTVSPETSIKNSQRIMAKGGRYLEAPIIGNAPSADDGTLVFLCAGDRGVFEDCETMFTAMSKRSLYVGEVGNAAKAKLLHQQLYGVITAGVAESLALADRVGISQQDLVDIFDITSLSSALVKSVAKEITESVFSPSFKLEQMQNELQMVSHLGHMTSQHLPVTSAANELFKSARRKGEGEMDVTAVYRALDM